MAEDADGVGFEVKRNGVDEPVQFPLPKEQGPYFIYIEYKCRPLLRSENEEPRDRGDFDIIYQVLDFQDDRKFDIEFGPEDGFPIKNMLLQIFRLTARELSENEEAEMQAGGEYKTIEKSEEQTEEDSEDRDDRGILSCELACQAIYISEDTSLP